jgi:hypothetical protein
MNKNTIEKFIIKSISVHGTVYDYSECEYKTAREKVVIICKVCGNKFLQTPDNHIHGQGCPKCGVARSIIKRTSKIDNFIQQANEVHKNKYDYSKVCYVNNNTPVIIICPIHGEFNQQPSNHLMGWECKKCGTSRTTKIQTKDQEDFIDECNLIHNNKYDYSLTKYVGGDHKIVIICPKHGNFSQFANNHRQGRGCAKCTSRVSKMEIEWLDVLKVPQEYRQTFLRINDKKLFADAFDPQTNTVYEFYGDVWHGNPKIYDLNKKHYLTGKTYGELYQKTLDKEQLIKLAGYHLISIWEDDFKILKKAK